MSMTQLRGRGSRRRSHEQEMQTHRMPVPESPPPSYEESMLTANVPPSFSDNDAAPAGRTVGDIGHSARNLSSERQGGELEESDEQVLREHVDLRQRCLRHFERWGQRYLWVVIVVFIGIILYATLIHFFPSFYVRQKHSTA